MGTDNSASDTKGQDVNLAMIRANQGTARMARMVDLICEYPTHADREWAVDYLASIVFKQEGWNVKIILERERGR